MATNKKITDLTAAGALTGVEPIEVVQGGINVQTTTQNIANLGGGGSVTSVTGTTNRITSSGGATPVINIDAAYDAAITAQIAAAQVGLWDDRGTFDASVAAYPSSGGSGTAGAILKGDIWTISVAGTLPTGQVVEIGDTVRALIDTPGNTQANWAILQNNIGFVPAPIASPTFTGTPAAPTAAQGTNTTQVATTAFVRNEIATPRVQTVASAATVTPNLDTDDSVVITAQAVGLTIANPTGTKRDMYEFTIRIKDNGTARAISFGTEYRVMEITLPTTTVISKYMFLQCCVNSVDTKIDVVAVVNEI